MSKKIAMNMVGQKVAEVRKATTEELEMNGWEPDHIGGPPTIIVLENGIKLIPSRDPEGNGPGCLFGMFGTGDDTTTFYA